MGRSITLNIFQEVKTLFALRGILVDDYKGATKMIGTDPGWKTSEFWTKVLTVDMPMILGALKGFIPPQIAAYVLLGSNVAYIGFRTWIKRGVLVDNLKAMFSQIKSGDTTTLETVATKLTTPAQEVVTP